MGSLIAQFAGITGSGSSSQATPLGNGRQLSLPWLDYASTAVPDTHALVMWWAQYLWLSDGNYRTAMERVIAHFITDLQFANISDKEQDTWTEILNKHINYRAVLKAIGNDLLCFGNSFSFLFLPFRRTLICNECGFNQPIDRVAYRVEFITRQPFVRWRRMAPCPRCRSTGDMSVRDRREKDLSELRVIQVPPDEVEIAYNRFNGKAKYTWNMSVEDRNDVRSGLPLFVENTPLDVLKAVAVNGSLDMNDLVFHHVKESTISSVKARGWGIPRSISNFRTAWLQQLVNKQDQAIAIDYTMGMRVLSPQPTPGGMDPMINHGNDEFVSRISQMVNRQRNEPVSYHTSPYPLQYQFLGGEGQNLQPFEKLKFRQQEYLNQLGVPLEYHQMNLTAQAAPMMLKLFENFWEIIPSAYNEILNWIVGTVARVYGLSATDVTMSETSLAYDLERKQVLLQLMAGQQVSADTALRPFGINAADEARQVMRYQRMIARLNAEEEEYNRKQQEMGALAGITQSRTPTMIAQEQEQAAAAQAQGGAPAGMGGGMPMGGAGGGAAMGGVSDTSSLKAMSEEAMARAQQLVVMPHADRQRELKALRETNPDLHGLVTANMEKLRNEARSQGGQMLLEQGGSLPA